MDLQKWLDSEANQKDMCGAYEYCVLCVRHEETPCANALQRFEKTQKPAKKQQPAEKPARKAEPTVLAEGEYDSLGKSFDLDKVMKKKAARKSLTFAEKYALSDDVLKERYLALQDAILFVKKGAPKIKSRISKQCDTYRRDGDTVAKITIIGTSLRVNLPLDPEAPEFNDGKTPHVNMAHKKAYETVPFQFKVNSKLALKRALALIELIK